MAFIIDTRRMEIVYRHPHREVLRSLINIEFVHTSTAIGDEEDEASIAHFSVDALRKMFKGLTAGIDPHSYDHRYLAGQVLRLVRTAKIVEVNEFDLRVQSMQILFHDKSPYRYAPGQHRAKELEEPYQHPALVGNWQAAQALPLTSAQKPAIVPAMAPAAPVVAPPWQATPGKIPPPWA